MSPRLGPIVAVAIAAFCASAVAQQPPPPPSFAAPNLSEKGVVALASNCASCHGTRGNAAPGSTVAGLAGRPAPQIVSAMTEFKEGKRAATLMHQIAKGYGEAEIAALADYFSKQR